MAVHYRGARWTQHTLVVMVFLAAVAVGASPPFANGWAHLAGAVSHRWLLTGGLMVLHTAVFWTVCAGFHYVDTHDAPAFIARFLSMYLFALLGMLTVLVHHSGYALPWASWAVPHDWHHYRMNELFGTTGHLDAVLGTDAEFRTLQEGDVR